MKHKTQNISNNNLPPFVAAPRKMVLSQKDEYGKYLPKKGNIYPQRKFHKLFM